ncbi:MULTISPECIES: hypothetical protein [Cupriavidus]|uniref:hypothetical protein n=1 Tax=Cupriavidus TaxID=106589 RepID=UPI0016035A5A|nr:MULTISPECIES: hypothetical protein [Cupriavidus]MBB1634743.1 hypothetical protein [Cupriavidus sp. UME77]MDR3382941.1 hypothetical protein [Cupriavidus basilensis]MDR3386735.1 hypothetical protein [Rudaea sp.]
MTNDLHLVVGKAKHPQGFVKDSQRLVLASKIRRQPGAISLYAAEQFIKAAGLLLLGTLQKQVQQVDAGA